MLPVLSKGGVCIVSAVEMHTDASAGGLPQGCLICLFDVGNAFILFSSRETATEFSWVVSVFKEKWPMCRKKVLEP